MPYGDLGDPWTAARRDRDPRWYALETAKGLVQTYGRARRHAEDYGSSRGSCTITGRCCRGGSWTQRIAALRVSEFE